MKGLLVFGGSGQVARALARNVPSATFLDRARADLTNPVACVAALEAAAPLAVINAAAYTAVDNAEADEATATMVNAATPAALARACAARDIPFIQYSTDYVFEGTGSTPWRPEDQVGPLSAYGRSKLLGEQGVLAAGGRCAILRTSWVFSGDGANFMLTMLRLGAERKRLSIVADQIGGPTPASALASAGLSMAQALVVNPDLGGTYHLSGAPDVSWADFAREIFSQAELDCAVEGIATTDYPTPAKRPANSRLDCGTSQAAFGLERPDWRAEMTRIISALRTKI